MSTTVSYKGETLTTVSNATKTLQTEGKYLEDDITLTDVSGGGSTLITKNISANGTYNASSDSADGYSQVNVAVPASAVDSGTKNITANGNNQDVVGYAAVNVNVPNTYSAGDEGKVVSNGALVAQTAHADVTPTTSDQTIDTTTNNSIKVKGDADLVASNIKKDVEIFGVTGTYEGSGGGDTLLNSIIERTASGMVSLSAASLGGNALRGCASVTGVCVPNCTQAKAEALKEMTALTAADLGQCGSIADRTFESDSNLATIILRKSSVCTLANIRAFQSTKYANGGAGGTIYVPSSLINSYKAASNWSTLTGYGTITWVAIEGSQYENYYADGTPIT